MRKTISERACEIAKERANLSFFPQGSYEVGVGDLAKALDEWQDRIEQKQSEKEHKMKKSLHGQDLAIWNSAYASSYISGIDKVKNVSSREEALTIAAFAVSNADAAVRMLHRCRNELNKSDGILLDE